MANNGFRLEVKQEYIKANFSNLLQYLRNYTKMDGNMDDYTRIVEAIKSEVYDYIDKVFDGCIYKNVVNKWDEAELEYVTKLFCAYLLTINKVDGKSDNIALATLCNILAFSGKVIGVDALFTVLVNCVQNKSVSSYSLGWNTIAAEGIILYQKTSDELAKTKFEGNSNKNMFEANGLLFCHGECIYLTNMNSDEYKKLLEQRKIGMLFKERGLVNIMTSKDKKLSQADASDILKLADACDEFKREISFMKPLKKVKFKKNYEFDNSLTIRVTDIRQFIDMTSVPEQIPEEKIESIDPRIIKSMMNLAYNTSKNPNQPLIDRYRDIAFAMFLAMLIGDTQDEQYFSFVMKFFKSVTTFARGEGLERCKLVADADFAEDNDVKNMLAIYKQLNAYRNEEVTTASIIEEMRKVSYLEYTNNKVAELVKSSNCLNGKLTRPEMNRIKKAIVTQLGADEEYRNITADETYYGEESDTLEFKTSIVFSPKNGMRPDLDNQMETIKKTVCAFLNSTTGGELLIGVNDSGYYFPLEGDIVYLFNTKKITEMSMDKYRLFVKYALDHAFKEVDGSSSGLDITADHVTCNISHNKEDKKILRIHVDPYEYGIVELTQIINDIYDTHSFLRTRGATVPMSKKMCEQTIKRKLRMQDKEPQ